jgi:predicted Rossmann-fold nucleotide-binding protein
MAIQTTIGAEQNVQALLSQLGRNWKNLTAASGDTLAVPTEKRVPDATDLFAGIDLIGTIDQALGKSAPRAVIFSTARDRDTIDYRFIHDLAFALVDIFDFKVGSGGGPGGMAFSNLGAVTAKPNRQASFGVAIHLPHEKPHTFVHPEQATLMESFLPRKMGLIHLSDMVIAVPGGYGTLEEVFEVLGLMLRGERPWQHLLLVEAGVSDGQGGFLAGRFYEPLKAMLSDLKTRGAFDATTIDRLQTFLHFVDAPDADQRMEDFLQLIEALELDLLDHRQESQHVTHPKNHPQYKEQVGQDLQIVHDLLEPLDASVTLSVIGASHMLDRETAKDVGKIVKKMMQFGANILYSGAAETNKRVLIEAQRVEKHFANKAPGSDRIPGRFLQIRGSEKINDSTDELDFTATHFMGRVNFASNPIRKAALTNYSHAYFFALGGIDTFDLLFEIMTLMQTQKLRTSPIIVYDPNGEWDAFDKLCQKLADYQTINPEDLNYVKRVKTIQEAEVFLKDVIRNGTPQPATFIPKPAHFDHALYTKLLLQMGLESARAETVAGQLVEKKILSHEVLATAKTSLDCRDSREQRVLSDLVELGSTDGPYGYDLMKAGLYARLPELRPEFTSPLPAVPTQQRLMGKYYSHRQWQQPAILNGGRLSYISRVKPGFTRAVKRGCTL